MFRPLMVIVRRRSKRYKEIRYKVSDDGTLIQILCFWIISRTVFKRTMDNVQKHHICTTKKHFTYVFERMLS
jgi:hypothetical protein